MSILRQYYSNFGVKFYKPFGSDTDIKEQSIDRTDMITRDINFKLTIDPPLKGVSLLDEMVYGEPVEVDDTDSMIVERMRAKFASDMAEEKMREQLFGEPAKHRPAAPPSIPPRYESGKIIDIKA